VADSTLSIPRRPLAFWSALAVLLIFTSATLALWVATYLTDTLV
jgi:hypothetical protein